MTDRFAVLSDTHDLVPLVEWAADRLRERGIRTVVHCGDITTPAVVRALEAFDVHWVLGNCDLDRRSLEAAMDAAGHTCHGLRGTLELGGRLIAFTHGHRPGILDALLAERPDLLVHGHTHVRRDETAEGVRILCPGALAHARPPGFALVKLPGLTVEWIDLA
jgi:putative phosphoesterase